LINADFRCPVNRNGQTEYTGLGYTIDLWKFSSPEWNLKISDHLITVSRIGNYVSGLSKVIENLGTLSGQIVTLSALCPTETTGSFRLYLSYTGAEGTKNAFTELKKGVSNLTIQLPQNLSSVTIQINGYTNNSSASIQAMKLELYPVQTLAHQDASGNWVLNDPPNYDLQYALCSLYSPINGKWVGYQQVNENLLDNAYFPTAINQRGATSIIPMNGKYQYFIDRWGVSCLSGAVGTFTIGPTGLDIVTEAGNMYWSQIIEGPENYAGMPITVSILTSDGLFSETNTFPNPVPTTKTRFLGKTFQIGITIEVWIMGNGTYSVQFNTNTVGTKHVIACKAELGPVQTLAHQDESGNWVLNDPPPNKALELAKCQRYYRRIDRIVGMAWPSKYIPVHINYPDMRINPAVKVLGGIQNNGGTFVEDITIESANFTKNSGVNFKINKDMPSNTFLQFLDVELDANL